MSDQSTYPVALPVVTGTWVPNETIIVPLLWLELVFEVVDETLFRNVFSQVIYYLTNRDFFSWVPERSACSEGSHTPLFNYLYINFDFHQFFTTTLIDSEISNLIKLARANGLTVSEPSKFDRDVYKIGSATLNRETVIAKTMRLHEIIIHRFSYVNPTMEPTSADNKIKLMNAFRRASLSLAIRVAFFAETTNTSETEVIRAFAENYDVSVLLIPFDSLAEPDIVVNFLVPPAAPNTPTTLTIPNTPTTLNIPHTPNNTPNIPNPNNTALAVIPAKFKPKILKFMRVLLRTVAAGIGRELLLLLFAA